MGLYGSVEEVLGGVESDKREHQGIGTVIVRPIATGRYPLTRYYNDESILVRWSIKSNALYTNTCFLFYF